MLVCGTAVLEQELRLMSILLMSYVAMLYAPVSELISVVQQILPAKVGIRRVFEVLDTAPEVEDDPDGLKEPLRGDVQFDDVSFSYERGDSVLTETSFAAKPGEVVAFVGPSGSGKTTIANLIARFYDRDSGAIRIDGRDIQEYALLALREQMSMVLQETHLFRGTILDNIRYGKPDASMEEIEAAARQANAHEFICFPTATGLCWGQTGHVFPGTAPAHCHCTCPDQNPRILILDEATSALDTVSETIKVQEALNHLMKDRTTFVIAHRLSTVQNADKIVVLKEGRVEQIGRHEDLIEADGLYRELYDPDWAKERKRQRDERIRQRSLKLPKGMPMTAISKTIRGWGVQLPFPKVFDVTVHYEPGAHFRFTRKIRNDFDDLARRHAQSTWLLGSHGGKKLACRRIYRALGWLRGGVGRLSLREGRQGDLLRSGLSPV